MSVAMHYHGQDLKNLDPSRTAIHLQRSEGFYEAMRLLADDLEVFDAAVALLAVQCAISLNDAVLVALTGKRSKYENHSRTLADLRRICGDNKVDVRGISHLAWLLTNKTAISYADKQFTNALLARDKAERFQAWAYSSFKGVLRA